jgi:nucleoside-diphosphate-sugar epimerase
MSRAILVTGATGKQGGALVNALLDANADFEVLAVTRNEKSDAAQKLAKRSPKIKLVQGDMNNPTGLFEAAKKLASAPIWGVFSVQVSHLTAYLMMDIRSQLTIKNIYKGTLCFRSEYQCRRTAGQRNDRRGA